MLAYVLLFLSNKYHAYPPVGRVEANQIAIRFKTISRMHKKMVGFWTACD